MSFTIQTSWSNGHGFFIHQGDRLVDSIGPLGYYFPLAGCWERWKSIELVRFVSGKEKQGWTAQAILLDLFPDKAAEIEEAIIAFARDCILRAAL